MKALEPRNEPPNGARPARETSTPSYYNTGDADSPYGSLMLRRDWSALRYAFVDDGWGIGYTVFAGRHHLGTDHVLTSKSLGAGAARLSARRVEARHGHHRCATAMWRSRNTLLNPVFSDLAKRMP